jgi:hypothetical protein
MCVPILGCPASLQHARKNKSEIGAVIGSMRSASWQILSLEIRATVHGTSAQPTLPESYVD